MKEFRRQVKQLRRTVPGSDGQTDSKYLAYRCVETISLDRP